VASGRRVTILPLTGADADAIDRWRYPGPDAVYDPGPGPLDADDGYVALHDAADGMLVGFLCTGAEARVPGVAPEPGVVDLGVGLRPDLVGGGWGRAVAGAALELARRTSPGADTARAVVLTWNTRSRRALARAGFTEQDRFESEDGRRFVVLIRPLGASRPDRAG
jgi:[ribosomal protein S18]-alanine N-acetyltransferase